MVSSTRSDKALISRTRQGRNMGPNTFSGSKSANVKDFYSSHEACKLRKDASDATTQHNGAISAPMDQDTTLSLRLKTCLKKSVEIHELRVADIAHIGQVANERPHLADDGLGLRVHEAKPKRSC